MKPFGQVIGSSVLTVVSDSSAAVVAVVELVDAVVTGNSDTAVVFGHSAVAGAGDSVKTSVASVVATVVVANSWAPCLTL